MFLKSLLAQHVSEVTASIVRSITESETDRDTVMMCPNTITSRMV
jgi:hypothetical protein